MTKECSVEDLKTALAESLKLQAHYAKLLNLHDGGQRRLFPDADSWIARLHEIGTLRGPVVTTETHAIGGVSKYQKEIMQLRESTGAMGVIAIVLCGRIGNGFGAHAPLAVQAAVPKLLRDVAQKVEKELPDLKLRVEGRQ